MSIPRQDACIVEVHVLWELQQTGKKDKRTKQCKVLIILRKGVTNMMASKDKRLINAPWLCIQSFSILHLAFRIMVFLMRNGLTYKTIGGIYDIRNMQTILHSFDDMSPKS